MLTEVQEREQVGVPHLHSKAVAGNACRRWALILDKLFAAYKFLWYHFFFAFPKNELLLHYGPVWANVAAFAWIVRKPTKTTENYGLWKGAVHIKSTKFLVMPDMEQRFGILEQSFCENVPPCRAGISSSGLFWTSPGTSLINEEGPVYPLWLQFEDSGFNAATSVTLVLWDGFWWWFWAAL